MPYSPPSETPGSLLAKLAEPESATTICKIVNHYPILVEETVFLRTLAMLLIQAYMVPRSQPKIMVPGQPRPNLDAEVNQKIAQAIDLALEWGAQAGVLKVSPPPQGETKNGSA